MEKLYIMNYPSSRGMGSSVNTMLVTDANLRRAIREEVASYSHYGKITSERLTGSWNNEVMCDSSDIAEVEEDVIRKRLSSCSTYTGVNDLIPVPDWIPIVRKEKTLKKRIFCVWNQFGFRRDVIAGSTSFIRYFLDLSDMVQLGSLSGKNKTKIEDEEHSKQKCWYEFTGFHMQNVLEQHYTFLSVELLEEMEAGRIKRLKSRLKNLDKQQQEWLLEAQATIRKFQKPISEEDTYIRHIYRDRMDLFHKINHQVSQTSGQHTRILDYRDVPAQYPLAVYEPGAIYMHHKEVSEYYRYDELFQKGMDVEYLFASNTGKDFDNRFGKVDAFRTLENVFGYD